MLDVIVTRKYDKTHGAERWAVIDEFGYVHSFHDKREDAEKEARLIMKVTKAIDEINEIAFDIIMKLSEEERKFLAKYTGGIIMIRVIE